MYIAVEDELSAAVGRRIVAHVHPTALVYDVINGEGFGYLKRRLPAFCDTARHVPVLLLTDLDRGECAPSLIRSWMNRRPKPENFFFRVCVREIEAWLLADHEGMHELFGNAARGVPANPEELQNPKEFLLSIAKKGPRHMRRELVAEVGAIAAQGIGYNATLSSFVRDIWCPERAAVRAPSLQRALAALAGLRVRD